MRIFVLIFLTAFSSNVFSQSSEMIRLQGIVVNSNTHEPIPFASIVLIDSNIGTAGNDAGKFTIVFGNNTYSKPTLKISSIGFISKQFSVDSLLNLSASPGEIIFALQTDATMLDAIEVSSQAINGKALIEEALEAVRTNTYPYPFTLEYYSTIKISDSVKTVYTEENVFEDFNQAGLHDAHYLHQRVSGVSPFAKSKCGLPAYFDILQMDILTSPFRTGIADINNLPQFEVSYKGLSTFEGDSMYVVEYHAPKPNRKLVGISNIPRDYSYVGKLYIDIHSHAIVRHSLRQGTKKGELIQEILYRKIDGFYFPYYIQSERMVNVDKGKNMPLTNILILRDATLESKRPASKFNNCNPPPYDKRFWDIFFTN